MEEKDQKGALTLAPKPEAAEADLIRAASEGDTDAFGILVERYHTFVLRVAWQATGGSPDAEDVAQEAFLKAWHAIGTFRGESSFSSWLYRITVNGARDALRKSRRRRTEPLEEPDRDGENADRERPDPDETIRPDEAAIRQETVETVRSAVAALPEKYREILVLRDMEDRSYEEIGELLSLEAGTVKSRLNRARQALKNILTERNFFG